MSTKTIWRATAATAAAAIAVGSLAACSAGAPADEAATDENVSISFTFWGNDVRAELYNEAIAEFEDQNPNIDVQILFLAPDEYWEKRQVEAAGGGLPDVVTMDLAYLRQYAQNNLLLDLEPYLGEQIATDGLDASLLEAGVVDGVTAALPLSTNAWGLYLNKTILDELGIELWEDGTWEEYYEWVAEVSQAAKAAGKDVFGGVDPTSRFTNFQLWLRAQGTELFDDEGQPGFDEDDLREYWEGPADLRTAGEVVPQQRTEEVAPLTAFDAGLSASDTNWDNAGGGSLANLPEGTELVLVAPPLDEEDGQDLYLKASQMYSIAANSEHPEQAATLIDFLVNSPESGEIFGSNRGLPASSTARDAAELDAAGQMIADYEASLGDRLGDAPPVPIAGYGTLHEKFRMLVEEINFGTLTVDQAVDQFFTEMELVLNQ